jgi:hypothetical protein
LFLLLYHGYHPCPAFPGTNAASLAVIQVGFKIPVLVLLNAPFRTKDLANAALNALIEVIGRPLGAPVPTLILPGTSGLGYNTANLQVFPS